MFRHQYTSVTGFQIADADDTIEERSRASVMPSLGTVSKETSVGRGDYGIKWPGEHFNFMFWRTDPNNPPTRGRGVGSYSYAVPARKRGDGKFLPLDIPGFLNLSYEPLDIEEAGPNDWIVLSTTKHGDRRKLAFRNGVGSGIVLIADHRGNNPPALSTFVHDGRGDSYDPDRKAGLDTAWEVRHWAPLQMGNTSSGQNTDGYSIAWVGDASPDGKGFCRIGYGDRDGLFAGSMGGPFVPSVHQKHELSRTPDGPIISGAISTKGYFRGSDNPFSAPLDFEERPYPDPMDSDFEYKVFLWYDANKMHWHPTGQKRGLWRWFTRVPIGETPKCSPTKDYSTTDANDNPRRTFAEDSRAFIPKKVISTGTYMMPRVNLVRGRIKEEDGSHR